MEFLCGTFIRLMYIFQNICNVILKALEKIVQEILKKYQHFHTSRRLHHMEGVTTITSQLHVVSVWDFHKSHVHISKYLPCSFDSFGSKSGGDI